MDLFVKAAEMKLMQVLEGIPEQPGAWQALHFHLSDLLEQYQSEYQVKIAINLIHDLLKNYEGGIFLMDDNSIIVLCYGLDKTIQSKLVFQLRYLYMDDPLAYTETGQENSGFCTVYDLRHKWREFYELCSQRMAAFTRRPAVVEWGERGAPTEMTSKAPMAPLEFSGAKLAGIEQSLSVAQMHTVIRRQPVCAVLPDMTVRRVFDELYINIAHLRRMLKSDVDFLSNRWLFKYLTRRLDERMVALIRSNPERYFETPVSLNLNVETLLSSTFNDLDKALKPASKISTILEVPVLDVFADMTAFIVAREQVHKLGYRICLDGLSTASFSSISRDKLGCDLLKLQWNADAESDLSTNENLDLAAAIRAAGSNRVILCRCDKRSAIEYGQALGISLFQGRYIDSVLNPAMKIEN